MFRAKFWQAVDNNKVRGEGDRNCCSRKQEPFTEVALPDG
jgi:hypothetical protein